MDDIYYGFALQKGDDDRRNLYGGVKRSQLAAADASQVAQLRADLVELGFFLAREDAPDKNPVFDDWLVEAVREFQIMARLPNTSKEAAEPAGDDKYLLRLTKVPVNVADRYPQAGSGHVDQYASGIVNATTRKLIALWKLNRWRCPWVIAEWAVPDKLTRPKKSLKPRSAAVPNATGYTVGARTLKRHDLTVSGRTPRITGEVFLHDFSAHYHADPPADPAAPDVRYYLGKEQRYLGVRLGPVGTPGLPDTQAASLKITPKLLTGSDLADNESAIASTFRVIGALGSVEAGNGLQMVNGYDMACLSLGVCQFALVSPNRREPGKVGKGELGGLLSWLAARDPLQFDKLMGAFGLRPQTAWGTNGGDLLNQNLGIWESYCYRETASELQGERIDTRSEANILQSWQWMARLTMLGFTSSSYARGNWAVARLRLQWITKLPIGGGLPNSWTLGATFSSERLVAKLLRIHVITPSKLSYRPDLHKPALCRPVIANILHKCLTPAEMKAGPLKWGDAVMLKLEAALDTKFPGFLSRFDAKGKLLKEGDFDKLANWRWQRRGLSPAAHSFQFYSDNY